MKHNADTLQAIETNRANIHALTEENAALKKGIDDIKEDIANCCHDHDSGEDSGSGDISGADESTTRVPM